MVACVPHFRPDNLSVDVTALSESAQPFFGVQHAYAASGSGTES